MPEDAWKEDLMRLFAEGLELPAAQRAAFVERVSGDDAKLRRELRSMLDVAATELSGFLESPLAGLPEFDTDAPPAPVIPGYVDLEPIGAGGMGTVYRARQVTPVQRIVAIKAIRPGMDSRQVLARFDAERQALARMAHPGIAVVHDAGHDANGRPYLAMEFVDGAPITDYCRQHQLALIPRLELFAKVCDAVDHAHRRGVLHRDLKPSNVLVVHGDGEPQPKVIDFGIAKALEGSLGDDSIHTLDGALLGTPEYMSPEQFGGSAAAIDTRTDVYSLGAILYELLCDARPHDAKRLRGAAITELARIVREETPPRPSTRLRERDAAARDAVSTRPWARNLHSDLDWVAMKALEKDPERRYASLRDFAEDLRRFLRHQPVEAGPPSGLYRMRKFARRYRIQLTAAVTVAFALTVGLFGTLWFLLESKGNEARAVQNASEATGTRLAATAALVIEQDPNLALLLAVEAEHLTHDFTVNETILQASQHHDLVGRFQHSDYGTTAALFVDARRLLSCGIDPVFWLTDVDADALERRFVGHQDRVHDLALSPSRERVVSGSEDHTARLWSLATGECALVVPHPDAVVQVRWAADGGSVLTLCRDGAVRRFAADTGALLSTVGDDLVHFEIDAADRLAAVSAGAGTVVYDAGGRRLWAAADDPWRGLDDQPLPVAPSRGSVMLTPGGQIVRNEERKDARGRVRLYAADGSRLAALEGQALRTLGDELMIRTVDGFTRLLLATGEQREQFPVEGITVVFAVTDDGRHAIAFDGQRDICVVDLERRRVTGRLSGENDKNRGNRRVALHPDGERFAITGRELLVGRFEGEYAPLDLPWDDRTYPMSLTADGEALVLLRHGAGRAARWSLWSIDRRAQLRDLPIEGLDRLQLGRGGSELQGLRLLDTPAGATPAAEVSTFDLEGRLLTRVTLPFSNIDHALQPAGDRYLFAEPVEGRPTARIFDVRTGAPLASFEFESGWLVWSGPEGRYMSTQWGSRTRTDVFDITTGGRVASVRGPAGTGHFGVAIDEQRDRMLVVLGDLRARSYALQDADAGPTGEYTRLVRSDDYPAGLVPDGSLWWVRCSNEVHLFDAVTCTPFAAIRLDSDCEQVAVRADSRELLTVTRRGRCQRWPLDTAATARRLAKGVLTRRERDLYRIGTDAERDAREREHLAANPTSRNLALLGEALLADGDLDGAIDAYRRCCTTGPLAPMDLRRYLRLLDLLGRRDANADRTAAARDADLALASTILKEALRCGLTRQAVADAPHVHRLMQHPDLRRLLPW
ncbi:MAG: protein kinase [Planctomycetes bacterium]|nr:protein kinase [Planctomycetota bacterium]